MSRTEYIGVEVKLITTLDEEHKGRIYTYDEDSNMMILYRGNENSRDFVFVNMEYIKDLEVTDKVPHRIDTEIPYIDVPKFMDDLGRQMEKEAQNLQQVNTRVTPEAQQIFNEISKTYKIDWDNLSIYFTDLDIKISPPYQNGTNLFGNGPALERITTVLLNTRRKLNLD